MTEVLSRYRTRVVLDGKETTPAKLLERLGFSSRHLYTRILRFCRAARSAGCSFCSSFWTSRTCSFSTSRRNDLDTDMLAVLEDLLDTWAGTLVMVTHDRYLMERVTDDQYALIGGKLRHRPRGVDEYLELLDERNQSAASGRTFADVTGQGAAAQAQQGASSKASDSGYTNAELREMKKRLASLNKKMGTAARKVEDKQAEMDGADPTDFVRLGELQAELDELRAAKKRRSKTSGSSLPMRSAWSSESCLFAGEAET